MTFIADPYRGIFDEIGFTPERIFTDPAIQPWRKLADRENCTWDISAAGQTIRLHVKRYPQSRHSPAELEARGYQLLASRNIPAAEVAAWGILPDGRNFIAMRDLAGFTPADKAVQAGLPFDRILIPTAELSARLHNAGLHHRDLYLCHFMTKTVGQGIELKLIDAARVRELPRILTRSRWVIKDLAQYWYSTTQLPITDEQRNNWLAEYKKREGFSNFEKVRAAVIKKSDSIARHDQRIRVREPGRNISIPK